MIRSFLFSAVAASLFLNLPVAAVAQESIEPSLEELDPGAKCFEVYPYGQLTMDIVEPASGVTVAPGDVVRIAGTIYNNSHALLLGGKVFVRILREDLKVAEQHWHPVVAEFTVDGVSTPAATTTAAQETFETSWQVPGFAPPGAYRAELSYLAADGSPLIGVTHVPNVFGAASIFTVSDGGAGAAVAWQRDQVLFNDTPFVFRAVPPQPKAGPLTIIAPLAAGGSNAVSVRVEKLLYVSTDVEGDAPLISNTESLVISPTQSTPVSFTWDAPVPGVYELVLKATPLDPHILPSILHVRFYYEGTAPRILHAGFVTESENGPTVAACFFNSTFGPEGGSGNFRVESDGTVVQSAALANLAGERVSLLPISASIVDAGFTLIAEAKDTTGKVTDTETVVFPGKDDRSALSAPENDGLDESYRTPWLPFAVGGVILLLILGAVAVFSRRRARQPLSLN